MCIPGLIVMRGLYGATFDAFNNACRYLDVISNIKAIYFDNMGSQIYPVELQLDRVNISDTEARFWGFEFYHF